MPDGEERVAVTTYVPASQRETWREDAEAMGMSQSEFLRSMVQAGRRGFSFDADGGTPEEPDVAGSDPGGNDVEITVLEILRAEGPLEWEALFESVAGDLEQQLNDAVETLMDEGRIRHRPRTGEYSVPEATDGD